ncbi:hypothetical protein, partial [Enterococcus gallinarum]|uniref:hypothetical protein n=1 Tax=Enterococcus gallinarum TaxID=1353 RepID=UPI003BDC29B3
MKIKRAFCTDCYEWRNVADLELLTGYDVDKLEEFKLILNANEIISIAEDTFEIFDEETGNWVE